MSAAGQAGVAFGLRAFGLVRSLGAGGGLGVGSEAGSARFEEGEVARLAPGSAALCSAAARSSTDGAE